MSLKSNNIVTTAKAKTVIIRSLYLGFLFTSWICFDAPPAYAVTIQPIINDKEVLLNYIEFDNPIGKKYASNMVGLSNVFHYGALPASAPADMNRTTIISPKPAASIPSNERHRVLTDDVALNTGFASVGGGTGWQPSSTIPTLGLGVTFETPVKNKEGTDVVIFTYSNSTIGANANSFYANALTGNEVSIPVGVTGPSTVPLDYTGTPTSPTLYRQTNPVASYAVLESKTLIAPMPNIPFAYSLRLFEIDLSDMGVLLGDSITGMFFQSSGLTPDFAFNPTFIAGLYAAPEPSGAMLMVFAISGMGLARRVVKRRLSG